MKLNAKGIAYITTLVYWSPSNGLWYLWGFILFFFVLLVKPEWYKTSGVFSRRVALYTFLFTCVFFVSFFINYYVQQSHLNNLLWSVITYFSSLLILLVLLMIPFKPEDLKKIFRFSAIVSVVQVFIGYFQMLQYQSFQYLNPFNIEGGGSAGDSFVGTTFDPGIGNLVAIKISLTILIFLPFWFKEKNRKNSITLLLLMFGWIVASAIYSLILGLAVIIFYFIIQRVLNSFSTFRLNRSIFFAVIIGVMAIGSFIYTQPDNVSYLIETIKDSYTTLTSQEMRHAGRKVVYYKKTVVDLPQKYPWMPLIGVGPGNYSSRSAWIVSGEYLQQQPSFIPVTPTPVAKEFNFSIWTKGLISDAFKGGGSITNQPFSSWFSVLAEMGLLGLLFFGWIFYTLSGAFNYVSKTSTDPFMQNLAMGLKMSLVYILLLFFVDNVFEWPLVMGQFFIFACALIRITEKEMHVAADHTISNTITGESIR